MKTLKPSRFVLGLLTATTITLASSQAQGWGATSVYRGPSPDLKQCQVEKQRAATAGFACVLQGVNNNKKICEALQKIQTCDPEGLAAIGEISRTAGCRALSSIDYGPVLLDAQACPPDSDYGLVNDGEWDRWDW